VAVTRLFTEPWIPLPSHRGEGLSASATIHTALFLLLLSFPNTPQTVPNTTPAMAGITVETIDGEIDMTPDDTLTPEQRGSGSDRSNAPPLDDDGGLMLDGLNVDLGKISRQREALFPFVTGSLPFLDAVLQRYEERPDRLVNPFGSERRTGELPLLKLDDAEYDRVIDRAWSRRVRWQSFSEIAALVREHDPNSGDAPLLVRSHLDHNLLQPYFDTTTRDPRYWVTLGLAADHEPFIQFVAAFVRDHPSSRATTELLFMLDEFAQASRDAMLMLLATDPDAMLGDTRAASGDAFALARFIDRHYRGWAQANRLNRSETVRSRFDDVRVRILQAIVASTPDGYGAADARFLLGRIYWDRNDRQGARTWWRDLAPDERESTASLARSTGAGSPSPPTGSISLATRSTSSRSTATRLSSRRTPLAPLAPFARLAPFAPFAPLAPVALLLGELCRQRMVIGCSGNVAARDDLAGGDPIDERARHEQVVETHVRVPGGERVTHGVGMQVAKGVGVAGVEDGLDGPPADAAAAQPDQGAQACR
jgi:hypothetical protein